MNYDEFFETLAEVAAMPQSKKDWLATVNNTLTGDLRNLVLSVNIPDYFWSIPSSSSGKYHPEDELGDGGLVRHTLKTVKVAQEMAPMYDLSKEDLDCAIAALLLHDTYKNGSPDAGHTVFEHPTLAAAAVAQVPNPCANIVANLISSHMGRWNTSKYSTGELPVPENELQKFAHLCDYIASRKAWDIKI